MENSPNYLAEMSVGELADILSGTIKYDDANKVIVFLGMLTAYTESDQLNICLLGSSSSGKSYIAKEVSKFFPAEDVDDYAGISPTALKYNGAIRDEETGDYHVDYERKIMIFSEMPHSQLLANMRSLLSHDSKETRFVVTDFKGGKDGNKVLNTIVRGYPAVVFCSASSKLNEQEATRCLLLSPEVSREKIAAGVALAGERMADPEAFNQRIESDPRRELLRQRIRHIKELDIQSVIVPNWRVIQQRFAAETSSAMPRHQRDITHLISLVKAVAMLNARQRLDEHHDIIAEDADIDAAIELWSKINASQMLGISPSVLDFYATYIVPLYLESPVDMETGSKKGVTRKEIILYYNQLNGRTPNDDDLRRNILPTLEANDMIALEKDGRFQLIIPLVNLDEPAVAVDSDDSGSFQDWVDEHADEITTQLDTTQHSDNSPDEQSKSEKNQGRIYGINGEFLI